MTLRLDQPFRWGGLVRPQAALIPHEGAAVAKAATGWQQFVDTPYISDMNQSPQAVMRAAQALYHSNPWIGAAERTVTRKVAGLPWHVEDADEEEVDDATPDPTMKAVRDLLEKPQAALPFNDRQPGLGTRRGMTEIISRHMGLCGLAFVFPDQPNGDRLPLALLYVNPARVFVHTTKNGALVGYTLDPEDAYGNGGIPLRAEELIPFYLEPPDWGYHVHGLPEAAALKARITTVADMFTASSLVRGGRRSGIVAPKDGYIDNADQYDALVRDFREREDHPDPRTTVLRGPVDFAATDQDFEDMGLGEIANMTRDDIFAVWGVPPSQAGIPQAAGLNSGEKGQNEYEVLMSGPVHDRVVVITETFQYELLDRWQAVGISPQLVIEEPSFDDDATPYQIASQATSQPLTNNDRRAILNLEPLPDYGPDGEPLGLAILLPATITLWGQGPEKDGTFGSAPPPEVRVIPPPPPAELPAGAEMPTEAKAALDRFAKAATGFLGLRQMVDQRMVPAAEQAVERVLRAQREDVARRLASASPRQLRDESYWWRGDYWDRQLEKALAPYVSGLAGEVAEHAGEVLG